jgi:hypothetical protein
MPIFCAHENERLFQYRPYKGKLKQKSFSLRTPLRKFSKVVAPRDTKPGRGTGNRIEWTRAEKRLISRIVSEHLNLLTIKTDERPVLLSLNGRGFYVLHYSAIPEQGLTRINFDLVDPNTGEGGSAEALVDPKLLEDLNSYNLGTSKGQAFLIWIDTSGNEVRWQLRKTLKSGTSGFNPP